MICDHSHMTSRITDYICQNVSSAQNKLVRRCHPNLWWQQELIRGCVRSRRILSGMAYRGARWSDPFASKTTRTERFAQMSKQEQLIEEKKREIQAKLEDQKKKETEEALKKLQGVSGNSRVGSGNKLNSQSGQHKGNRKQFWKRYVVRRHVLL